MKIDIDFEDDYSYLEDTIYFESILGLKDRPKKPDMFNSISINTPYYFDLKAKKEYFIEYENKHKNLLKSFDDKDLLENFNFMKFGYDKPFLYFYDNREFNNALELELYIYAVDKNLDIERCPGFYDDKNYSMIYPDFKLGNRLIYIVYPFEDINHRNKVKDRYPNCEFWTEKDFEEISQHIYDNYSDDYLPLFYKDVPFPWPNANLKDTSPMGLVRHFHKSIMEGRHKDEPTILELWNNKEIFKQLALNRLLYVGECNVNRMRQGYNIAKIATKISVFKNTTAIELIKTYLYDAEEIFDPFSGFSGRMLGAIQCGKPYIGRDINAKHIEESKQILSWWKANRDSNVQVDLKVADATKEFGVYDCLLTCSPYATIDRRGNRINIEDWNNEDQLALTCDEWIDICLLRYKCRKYVFVVDDTVVKYRPYVVGSIGNHGHMGRNIEYVVYLNFTNYSLPIYNHNKGKGLTPFDIDKTKQYQDIGNGITPFDIPQMIK